MKFPSLTIKGLAKPKESKLFLALVPTLKEKKTQQFTTLVLTGITIIFFGFFAIAPTVGTISDLQKQLDDSNFVNTAMQKKIANLTTLQTTYTQIQPSVTPVYDAVPNNPGIDTFAGQIHQIAATANVQLNRIETQPVALSVASEKTPYLSYAFIIEAQADLPTLQQFVKQLGNFNRLITFDTIDYTRSGNVAAVFRATIRGEVYFKEDVSQ